MNDQTQNDLSLEDVLKAYDKEIDDYYESGALNSDSPNIIDAALEMCYRSFYPTHYLIGHFKKLRPEDRTKEKCEEIKQRTRIYLQIPEIRDAFLDYLQDKAEMSAPKNWLN